MEKEVEVIVRAGLRWSTVTIKCFKSSQRVVTPGELLFVGALAISGTVKETRKAIGEAL